MRFHLVDNILELEPGRRIAVSKVLSRAEEYLADHFPKRPVMPGVLMLQVCVEAGMWLLRAAGKAPCGAVLSEVRNVKYGSFFEPGGKMRAEVELVGEDEGRCRFKAEGRVGGERVISARMVLEPLSVDSAGAAFAHAQEKISRALDERYELIRPDRSEGK